MPKSEIELKKHTLNLFAGDFSRLDELHPDIGASTIIRKLIRAHIKKVEARLEARLQEQN